MAFPREAIIVALHKRLEAKLVPSKVARVTRTLLDVTRLHTQPAIVVVPENQGAEAERPGLPPIWRLRITLVLYVRAEKSEGSGGPDTPLNLCIQAIESALAPDTGMHVLDLGGLCERCEIVGDVEIACGQDQYVAEIPIVVLGTSEGA